MFNLYTYEKKLREYKDKEEEEIYMKQLKLKQKKKVDEFSKHYDGRMRNFIFSMCEKPIILGKNKSQIQLNKTFNDKRFTLYDYKTQKQRLKELESYKNKLNEYDEQRKNNEKKRNILKIKNHRDLLLIQPEMKFMSKSKLEKILDSVYKDKDDVTKINTSAPLLDIFKQEKLPKPKRIKEFYRLIDKKYLNDLDVKNTIKYLDDVEQNEKEINYTYRNYLSWKQYKRIIKSNKMKMSKTLNYIDTNNTLKSIGKEEKDILKKNDIKTHFRGAEQYILFKELRENKKKFVKNLKFKTTKNNEKEKKKSEADDKAMILAMKLAKRNKKNEIETYPKDKLKSKKSRNFDFLENPLIKKKFPFMVNISPKEEKQKKLNRKRFSFKEQNNNILNKKLTMNNLMDNEISHSISKDFMKKHHSINVYGKLLNIPKGYELADDNDINDIGKDNDLKEKKNILIRQILSERRKMNDEKYKIFVKKYCRSIFGFKGVKLHNTSDEIKAENKLDYVAIDGKPYNKKDIKLISNIIFHRCNYYNKKRNYNE